MYLDDQTIQVEDIQKSRFISTTVRVKILVQASAKVLRYLTLVSSPIFVPRPEVP